MIKFSIIPLTKVCILLALFLSGCGHSSPPEPETTAPASLAIPETAVPQPTEAPTPETQKEETVMEMPSPLLSNPQDSDFVRVRDYIPDIQEELFYATENNFTGKVIYDFQDVYLRYGTVKKLMAVQEELRGQNLGLKIWDGFRPVSAQFKLWEICPDDTYVANPNVGYSNHSRGFAVDLTLVDSQGRELEMPTAFDDFSGRADRNFSEIPEIPRANARLLEAVMEKHGFKGYYGEWWHYNDTDRYEPEMVFDPGLICPCLVIRDTPLLPQPSLDAFAYTVLSPGDTLTVMGYDGDYALAVYCGLQCYALRSNLQPIGY